VLPNRKTQHMQMFALPGLGVGKNCGLLHVLPRPPEAVIFAQLYHFSEKPSSLQALAPLNIQYFSKNERCLISGPSLRDLPFRRIES
jgi:hypothetical protein